MTEFRDKLERAWMQCRIESVKTSLEPALPAAKRKGIPVLDGHGRRRETPMLSARFDFGDRWEGAPLGLEWLGLSDMEDLWDSDHELWELIHMRREHWRDSPIAHAPLQRLSLLAADESDPSEVYLLWPEGEGEPEVLAYHQNSEHHFANLEAYIDWMLE